MPLGPVRRRPTLPLAGAALACLLALAGCGDGSADAEVDASPAATSSAPATPSSAPETVAPATGPALRMKAAELRMPRGWQHEEDFGVSFIQQGSSGDGFGTVSLAELAGADPGATSLDAIARRMLRSLDEPRITRRDDVVIGGDTMAYRLVGRTDRFTYEERYGVLVGDLEYEINFIFTLLKGKTPADARPLIDSMLASWTFNP